MKTANIIKVADGYEIVLELDEKTPSGKVIYQEFIEKNLDKVFETLKTFYKEESKKFDKQDIV